MLDKELVHHHFLLAVNRWTVVETSSVLNFLSFFRGRVNGYIKAEEGDFIREATGYEEIGNDGYGNAVNNAEASALRRCCAKFQLGLQFWHK